MKCAALHIVSLSFCWIAVSVEGGDKPGLDSADRLIYRQLESRPLEMQIAINKNDALQALREARRCAERLPLFLRPSILERIADRQADLESKMEGELDRSVEPKPTGTPLK